MYLSPWKFFRNQILLDYLGRWRNQSCQIFFQSVHSGVSGKGSNFAIFSANRRWPLQLLYYRTTVIPHSNTCNPISELKEVHWWFFQKIFFIEIHEKNSTVYYRLSKCNFPKKIGCNRFRVLNNTPIINSPLNVKFSHFFMNKKNSYFRFFSNFSWA